MSIVIYDEEYHKKFLERANTELGKKIYAARWDFIEGFCHGKLKLLDYGCASGAFHKSAVNGYETYGYDVNPHCGFPTTPDFPIDILTMWDSIEHLHDPVGVIRKIDPTWIFLTTPNLESVKEPVRNWRHYRPREHIHYFDLHSLTEILDYCGYQVIAHEFKEGALRDPQNPTAIITVAAVRK